MCVYPVWVLVYGRVMCVYVSACASCEVCVCIFVFVVCMYLCVRRV